MLRDEAVRARCTISSRDSSDRNCEVGTLQHCAHVLLDQLRRSSDSQKLVELLEFVSLRPGDADEPRIDRRVMSSYIECQLHGDVLLSRDVAFAIVSRADVDAGGDMLGLLQALKRKYGVALYRFTRDGMVPL